MGSKQPAGAEKKKPGKNLKEKRAAKQEKKAAKGSFGPTPSR